MSAPLRLVVFDMDGTLIDSQHEIMAAMSRAFGGLGVALPDRDTVLSIVGLSLPQAMAKLAPGLSSADLEEAVHRYRAAFREIRAETGGEAAAPLYPGGRAALEALAARDEVLMGVATGKSRRGLVHALATHNLQEFFVTTQTADDHPSKPHPAMLDAALAETGAEVAQAVMIGDTSFDIEMGRTAGFATVGVCWGYHSADALTAAGADRVIDGFEALVPALDELWGAE